MHYITIEQREFLQRVLAARFAALRDSISEMIGGDGERHGFANHREETDDDAVIDLEASLETMELERRATELREVEQALVRLHTAGFGECDDCGAEIPFSRLRANALATRCIRCQESHEEARAARRIPRL